MASESEAISAGSFVLSYRPEDVRTLYGGDVLESMVEGQSAPYAPTLRIVDPASRRRSSNLAVTGPPRPERIRPPDSTSLTYFVSQEFWLAYHVQE